LRQTPQAAGWEAGSEREYMAPGCGMLLSRNGSMWNVRTTPGFSRRGPWVAFRNRYNSSGRFASFGNQNAALLGMTRQQAFALEPSDALTVHSARPLDNFPLVRSRDVEEARAWISRMYAAPVLIPTGSIAEFNAIINACQLKDVGFHYGAFGAATRFEFPGTAVFCQLIPIRGHGKTSRGRVSALLTAGSGAVTSSDEPHTTEISADYEHLVLRIGAAALTKKLAAMTGATIGKPLRIEPQQNFKHPAAIMLQRYVPLLVETLNGAAPPFPDWWVGQTEQLLMTLFLCGHQHNYSHLLEQTPADAAPQQVRQAEEYIEANVERAVSLEELAELTGISALSLYAAFRKSRGYSPREFAKRLRMKPERS
jgi:hypothetical protein